MSSYLIYNFTKLIETIKRGLGNSCNGMVGVSFLMHFPNHGLSQGGLSTVAVGHHAFFDGLRKGICILGN